MVNINFTENIFEEKKGKHPHLSTEIVWQRCIEVNKVDM